MNVFAEFVPKHFEKALDIARHVGSYARLEFRPENMRLCVMDPAKAVYMDTYLFPQTYKIDKEFCFGINLNMMYKLIKSLDNNIPIEIEANEEKVVLTQIGHRHEFGNQTLQYDVPEMKNVVGPVIRLDTKSFQKHVRALSNVSPVFELSYDPASDSMFMESVNSIYKTTFAVDTSDSNNEAWPEPYKNQFLVKLVETVINPSLGDKIWLELGEFLMVRYEKEGVHVGIIIANYTEG